MAAGCGAVSEHQAFFVNLPPNDLLPLEADLRKILISWLHMKQGPFPLIEWIDRRIGGEVETRKDSKGYTEIFLRGASPMGGPVGGPMSGYAPGMPPHIHHPGGVPMGPSPPPPPPLTPASSVARPAVPGHAAKKSAEAFFKRLPRDQFGAQETTLREAVFEFLAKWKPQELATLPDLAGHLAIKIAQKNFLPKDVPLMDWIERRIGGELELRPGPKGEMVVHLTQEGKRLVREKYEQMSTGATGLSAEPASRDTFFSTLPSEELLPGEVVLRQEIMDFLTAWSQKKPGTYPTVTELTNDAKVTKARTAFMPPKVKLRSWIERRVGGEIEIRKPDHGGEHQVMFRGAPPPAPPAAAPGRNPADSVAKKPTPAQAFFADLPEDELTDAEQDLRVAILDHLQERGHSPPLLTDVCRTFQKDPVLSQTKAALLPSEVSLQVWINRRIGGEVEICRDGDGRQVMKLRGSGEEGDAGVAAPQMADGDAKENFFANLPSDEFGDAECQLRDALMAFLQNWRRPQPPSLSVVKADREVARIAKEVVPPGCSVDLADWILRRIGGEVEVLGGPRDNQKTLQLVDAGQPQAKRRR